MRSATRNAIETVAGFALDIAAVVWICIQRRWLLAGFTFAILPLLSATVLGLLTGLLVKFRKPSDENIA